MKKTLLQLAFTLGALCIPFFAHASLGDIYYGSTTYPYTTALPIGNSGYVLTSNGNTPVWQVSSGGGGSAAAATPNGGLQFSIPSGTSSVLSATSSATISSTTGQVTLLTGLSIGTSSVFTNGLSLGGNETLQASPMTIASSSLLLNMKGAGYVKVRQHIAYVTADYQPSAGGSLTIYDVSSSTNPIELSQTVDNTHLDGAEDMGFIDPNDMLIANLTNNSLACYNISNPKAPVLVGFLQDNANLNGVEDFVIAGKYAYTINANTVSTSSKITTVDISNCANMTIVGTTTNALIVDPVWIRVKNQLAYITNESGGSPYMSVVSLANPLVPVVLKNLTGAGWGAMVGEDFYGRYLYLADDGATKIHVIDISSSTNPIDVADVSTSAKPWTLWVSGQSLYYTSFAGNAVVEMSLASSTNPVQTNIITSKLNTPDDIFPNGGYWYTSNNGGGNQGGMSIIKTAVATIPSLQAGSEIVDNLEVTHDEFVNRLLANTSVNTDYILANTNLTAGNINTSSTTASSTISNLSISGNTYLTNATTTSLAVTGLGTTTFTGGLISPCFATSSVGPCITPGTGGAGAVSSVSNSDNTLTVSPTTGSVVASLNLSNINTWIANQNFNGGLYVGTTSSINNYVNFYATSSGYQIMGVGTSSNGYLNPQGAAENEIVMQGNNGFADIFNRGNLNPNSLVGLGELDWENYTNTTNGTLSAYIQANNTTGSVGNEGSDLTFATKQDGVSGMPVVRLHIHDNGEIEAVNNMNVDGALTVNGNSTTTSLNISGITGSTQCLHVDTNGNVSGTGSDCGSGSGAVSSVSNSDNTLTVSPTTGAVVASLNLASSNSWTATTTKFNGNFSNATTTGTTTFAGSTQIGTTTGSQMLEDNGGFAIDPATVTVVASTSISFCSATTNSYLTMAASSSNVTVTFTGATACPGKTIIFEESTPSSGTIGSTTFVGGAGSGAIAWIGGINPGNSIVNGSMDTYAFMSSIGTSTAFIKSALVDSN